MTQEEEAKIRRRLHAAEKIQYVLDRACLGMEIFCIVMNLLSGNWICALIWFNVVLWNYRAIRDTAQLQKSDFECALLGYLLYSKLAETKDDADKQNEQNENAEKPVEASASEVIDVESKEVSPEAEEKKDA